MALLIMIVYSSTSHYLNLDSMGTRTSVEDSQIEKPKSSKATDSCLTTAFGLSYYRRIDQLT